MKEVIVEKDFGIVERRKYDDEGKLVEIRKEYPASFPIVKFWNHVKVNGASGGSHLRSLL